MIINMESKDSSLETQDTEAAKLAARILHRELQRASIERLKRTGQLRVIQIGPTREKSNDASIS